MQTVVIAKTNLALNLPRPSPSAGSPTDSGWVACPPMGTGLLGSAYRVVTSFCVVLGLLYLGFSASSIRYADPGLKSKTRATAVFESRRRPKRTALAAALSRTGGTPALRVVRRARRYLVRTWPVLVLSAALPPGRHHGEDALGVSLPRSRRWAVLGGHGRFGAG